MNNHIYTAALFLIAAGPLFGQAQTDTLKYQAIPEISIKAQRETHQPG